jgi:hypothetical protein
MKAETIINVGDMPPPQSRSERPVAPGAETLRYDPRTRALIEGPIVPHQGGKRRARASGPRKQRDRARRLPKPTKRGRGA